MATKVEPSSASASSSSSSKVSMFGAKSGFVIPKNKLSGGLVRLGGRKTDNGEAAKEEGSKQVQRKTKWGVDLTLDAFVRKGRALAYQTRVNQITKQLKSGALEIEENQSLQSPSQLSDQDSTSHLCEEPGKHELLELEKREAIGEILRLNSNYKAPADYKPLLKEAKVPVPIKSYPGYNFIGLLLGPESNTQKRLEEETGAKICIQCTKADTGEKKEITISDVESTQADYAELYVHISAETYDKVDSAVALIELLLTPLSGNSASIPTSASVSENQVNATDQIQVQVSAAGYAMPMVPLNPSAISPLGPASRPLVQFQSFAGPWVQGPPNTTFHPPSSSVPSPNLTLMPNNSIRFLPPPMSPFNLAPHFGARPPPAFGSIPRNPSHPVSGPQQPMQVLRRPFASEAQQPPSQTSNQQVHPMQNQQRPLVYPAARANPLAPPFAPNQLMPPGPTSVLRPSVPMSVPQQMLPSPSGQPWTSMPNSANSSGWASAHMNMPPPARPSSMMQTVPPSAPQASRPAPRQSFVPTIIQSSIPGTVVGRPPGGSSAPPYLPQPSQLPTTTVNNQSGPPTFASMPHVGASSAIQSSQTISNTPMQPNSGARPPNPRPLPIPIPRATAQPVFSPAPLTVNASSPSMMSQAPSSAQLPSIASMQPVIARVALPVSSSPVPQPSSSSTPVSAQAILSPQRPLPSAPNPVSGSVSTFSPGNASTTSSVSVQMSPAPKPHRPSSNDFTFQPQRPHTPSPPNVQKPPSQAPPQSSPVQVQTPLSIQPPSAPPSQPLRPAMNNPMPPKGGLVFPRLPTANQMSQPQASIPSPNSVSFPSDQGAVRASARPLPFPDQRGAPIPAPRMGPPSYFSAPQIPSPRDPFPTRPMNQAPPMNRPGNVTVQNQQSGYAAGRPLSAPSGGNQIYDPFSPTSIPAVSQQQGSHPVKKQETDAEYEDLMASVGVR